MRGRDAVAAIVLACGLGLGVGGCGGYHAVARPWASDPGAAETRTVREGDQVRLIGRDGSRTTGILVEWDGEVFGLAQLAGGWPELRVPADRVARLDVLSREPTVGHLLVYGLGVVYLACLVAYLKGPTFSAQPD